jgi:hypothetical protein
MMCRMLSRVLIAKSASNSLLNCGLYIDDCVSKKKIKSREIKDVHERYDFSIDFVDPAEKIIFRIYQNLFSYIDPRSRYSLN